MALKPNIPSTAMLEILKLFCSFVLFSVIAVVSATKYKEYNTKTIVCPSEETLVQAMTDGNDVLCVYTKESLQSKKLYYKKGVLT